MLQEGENQESKWYKRNERTKLEKHYHKQGKKVTGAVQNISSVIGIDTSENGSEKSTLKTPHSNNVCHKHRRKILA